MKRALYALMLTAIAIGPAVGFAKKQVNSNQEERYQLTKQFCASPQTMKGLMAQVESALRITDLKGQEAPMTCTQAAGTWDNFIFEVYNSLPPPIRACKRYEQQIKRARASLQKRGDDLEAGCVSEARPSLPDQKPQLGGAQRDDG
jgi:hypothetical protein